MIFDDGLKDEDAHEGGGRSCLTDVAKSGRWHFRRGWSHGLRSAIRNMRGNGADTVFPVNAAGPLGENIRGVAGEDEGHDDWEPKPRSTLFARDVSMVPAQRIQFDRTYRQSPAWRQKTPRLSWRP